MNAPRPVGIMDALLNLQQLADALGGRLSLGLRHAGPTVKMPGAEPLPREHWRAQREAAERARLDKAFERKALAQEIAAALRDTLTAAREAPAAETGANVKPSLPAAIQRPPIPDPIDESWRDNDNMEMIERRARAISWLIESKEFDRMSLEAGDKGRLKGLCEHEAPALFKGKTVFDDAWKIGSKRQWWRMKDYAKFTKNRLF